MRIIQDLVSRKITMKTTIAKINAEAFQNNCFCLNTEYDNCAQPLDWVCKKGHMLQRPWAHVNHKRWCSQCHHQEKLVAKLKKFVEEKEGIVDLKRYVIHSTKLTFICKNNHIWQAKTGNVANKHNWCSVCSHDSRRLSIDVAHKVAEQRNGKCLSTEYIRSGCKLLWECYYKHQWYATLNSIKDSGCWCSKCNINIGEEITRRIFNILFDTTFIKIKPKWLNGLELDGFCEEQNLAFEYDGQQHYDFIKYFHKTQEKFKNQVKMDRLKDELCVSQKITLLRIPYWIKYEDLVTYIVKLSKKNDIKIPNNVDIDYNQFKDIYKINEGRFQAIKKIVKDKKGTLLTDNYVSAITKFEVKCEKGHIWSTFVNKIQSGSWCPNCAGNIKHDISHMHELAGRKNGKCLSTKYVNAHTNLLWECKKKHTWYAKPNSISIGSWCSQCAGTKSYTIDAMKKLAIKKEGKCLSKEYGGVYSKLKWKCKRGHIWDTNARQIIRGCWCGKCSRIDR